MLARWAWEVLGWLIPGGRAGGQPPAAPPTPPIMHHWAGAGARWWGWGSLAASGLTKDPLYCLPTLTSLASLVSSCPITQPWPALPWTAFLTRLSFPPSQAMFLESLGLGNSLTIHLRVGRHNQSLLLRSYNGSQIQIH